MITILEQRHLRIELNTTLGCVSFNSNNLTMLGDIVTPTIPSDKPLIRDFGKNAVPSYIINLCQNSQWLIFCYSELPYYNKDTMFFNEVFQAAINRQAAPLSAHSEAKYKRLLLLAALCSRASITNQVDFTANLKSKHLAKLLGVKEQTWRATWKSRWEILMACFVTYDQFSLNELDKKIKANRYDCA